METGARRLGIAAIVLLAVIALVLVALWAGQRRLIYLPDTATPSTASLPPGWESVSYETSDGLTLGAWLHRPSPDEPIIIVFSGNAGNRSDRLTLGTRLGAEGAGVLLTDYRGYGGNPGRPREEGLAVDARAALSFAETATPGHPIVYFGESLGAAVAVELATEAPPAALVLRSPFTSLEDAARANVPWLPFGFALKDRFPSDERIRGIDAPLLVIAGTDDRIVPIDQSRRLHAMAHEPKHLVVVEGAGHNDLTLSSGEEMTGEVLEFVSLHTGPSGP